MYFINYILPNMAVTQPVHHTVHTSPTRCTETHHTTASSVTPHRINNFNSQIFNHYPFLTHIYITHNFNWNYNNL